jgi:hypothetical protein
MMMEWLNRLPLGGAKQITFLRQQTVKYTSAKDFVAFVSHLLTVCPSSQSSILSGDLKPD